MSEDSKESAPASVQLDGDKLEVEFQKYITDTNPLLSAFYSAFSGHRVIRQVIHKTGLGGKDKEIIKEKLTINKTDRVMNEDGSAKAFYTIMPLINQLATTSTLTDLEIYNAWHIKVLMLRFALLDSYYLDNNPYQLKIHHLADITTSILGLYFITAKAKGGFTLHELAESFVTQEIRRTGVDTNNKKIGLIEGIQKGFNAKQ